MKSCASRDPDNEHRGFSMDMYAEFEALSIDLHTYFERHRIREIWQRRLLRRDWL